ncbi:hypothetical protein DL96DRAFT_1635766 [Flagelloscypha sp. PMI_526]|nr:hypothetical protein DL96DRAFT_1635766 [Flagelloscypha sp. PMI_526]
MTAAPALSLPSELWLQIAQYFTNRTLRSFQGVNRFCCTIANELFMSLLDLAPQQTSAERLLSMLNHRIDLTSSNPSNVRVLCLTSRLSLLPLEEGTIVPHSSGPRLVTRVKGFLNQTFVRPLPLSYRLDSRVEKLIKQMTVLIPELTGVHELYIMDKHAVSFGPFNAAVSLAWRHLSPRLTTLSLHLSIVSVNDAWFPNALPSLPLLRTFQIHIFTSDVLHRLPLENILRTLLRDSSLLEEMLYHVGDFDTASANRVWYPEDPSLHPCLRSFKWSSSRAYQGNRRTTEFMCPRFQAFMTKFGSQFDIVHMEPAPSKDFFPLLDFTRITELRIDVFCYAEYAELLSLVASNGVIETLEISGCYPSLTWRQFYQMLGKMVSLQTFYLPLFPSALTALALTNIAVKTPNLKKLVVIFESEDNVPHPVENVVALDSFGSPIPRLHKWPVQDFGILVSGVPMHRQPFDNAQIQTLLNLVGQLVPSIKMFYGHNRDPRSFNWEMMDDHWPGELMWESTRKIIP